MCLIHDGVDALRVLALLRGHVVDEEVRIVPRKGFRRASALLRPLLMKDALELDGLAAFELQDGFDTVLFAAILRRALLDVVRKFAPLTVLAEEQPRESIKRCGFAYAVRAEDVNVGLVQHDVLRLRLEVLIGQSEQLHLDFPLSLVIQSWCNVICLRPVRLPPYMALFSFVISAPPYPCSTSSISSMLGA